MKNYMKLKGLCFFFSLYSIIAFSMELERQDSDIIVSREHRKLLKPEITTTLFDFKKQSNTSSPLLWQELLPENMMITSDGQGIITSHYGAVKYVSFNAL